MLLRIVEQYTVRHIPPKRLNAEKAAGLVALTK
ncbi:MAG: hypothetical protein ACJASL_003238 [Paraglaciecola sp.]|jgi:hypothetical protein